jgi:Conjugative transposon protein TcpC
MVRRAILDRGESGESTASEDQALPPSQFPADPVPQQSRPWRGAGGRWLVWAGRAIVWAVLLIIGYRGVLAIVAGQAATPASTAPPVSVSSTTSFPTSLAEAYALQFGRVYLNFSPATSAARGRELSRFLAPGADPQLGWNGAGTEQLLSEQVAGITVTGAHSAVVTLLATIDDGRMIELGVPVYAARGALVIPAAPALLPAPARAAAPAVPAGSDQAAETALASQLPAFFQAYASGDKTTLARFAGPGSHIRSLAGTVTFGAINSVNAPRGGARRSVTVTVTWKLAPVPGTSGAVASAPAALEMTYQLTVIRQGGSWDVLTIGPASQLPAQGPP